MMNGCGEKSFCSAMSNFNSFSTLFKTFRLMAIFELGFYSKNNFRIMIIFYYMHFYTFLQIAFKNMLMKTRSDCQIHPIADCQIHPIAGLS